MKNKLILIIVLALCLTMTLSACSGGNDAPVAGSPTPTPSYTPGGGGGDDSDDPQDETSPDDDGADQSSRSSPYHDSIWVLEGSGSTTLELEAGYYATYSVDLSLVKLEGGSAQGTYQGGMYVTVDIDAEEFIENMLKNIPAELGAYMNFDVSAYALDNLTQLSLWNYYQYPGADWTKVPVDASGKEVAIAKDSYLGEGDIVMRFEVEGIAEGGEAARGLYVGVPGISAEEDGMIGYMIYCPPNGEETGDQNGGVRRAVITLTMRGETNVPVVIEGTLTRLPGGLENQDKFAKDRKPFSEKHDKDDTTLTKNLRP